MIFTSRGAFLTIRVACVEKAEAEFPPSIWIVSHFRACVVPGWFKVATLSESKNLKEITSGCRSPNAGRFDLLHPSVKKAK
jgi:hypothetical protein